jgi:prepilin-type N-terminal cleavage/methylation domain-containing protein
VKFKFSNSNQKGMTLLEILLALTILSIIFVSVIPFLLSAVKNNKMVENNHQSIYVAKEQLAVIQSSADIQEFLEDIQNVQPSVIAKSAYPNLNLFSDIITVQLQEKNVNTNAITVANYYVLKIKEGLLMIEVNIRTIPDYNGNPKLYRTIINVYDENNKLLTKSFGYIKYRP